MFVSAWDIEHFFLIYNCKREEFVTAINSCCPNIYIYMCVCVCVYVCVWVRVLRSAGGV